MNIKRWFVTGDTHGAQGLVYRLRDLEKITEDISPQEVGLIVLGDAGINYLGETLDGNNFDYNAKKTINKFGFQIYILRGNHEIRPSTVNGMIFYEDSEVGNYVYTDEDFRNIHYFLDGGGLYFIDNHHVVVIPGAYSVDKSFRLATGKQWFRDEQMTEEEKENLKHTLQFTLNTGAIQKKDCYPIVLSHTCPLSWEPYISYLFLNEVDQENVDKNMEKFLDQIRYILDKYNGYEHWYFGHFHDDKDIDDVAATMLFKKIIPFGEWLEE